ncbi:MAG: hypothetical protein CMJ46_07160 [Planctomyces sp.]|nr:hypothetical protein [Planctomyces sp.]
MALEESDREDLMREATALKERMEIQFPSESEPFVFGYRKQGELSCFLGQDPVYHFDPDLQLKRAFIDGLLYRTQGTTLAQLTRVRTTNPETDRIRTELQRHDLTTEELETFRQTVLQRLINLKEQIQSGSYTVLRRVPEDVNFLPRLTDDLGKVIDQGLPLGDRFKGKR